MVLHGEESSDASPVKHEAFWPLYMVEYLDTVVFVICLLKQFVRQRVVERLPWWPNE